MDKADKADKENLFLAPFSKVSYIKTHR